MTILYVGTGLIAVALVAGILLVMSSTTGPTGVAKSLALIDQTVTDRTVARTDLSAQERLVEPLFNRTKGIARALSPSGTEERLARMLDRAGQPRGWSVERLMGAKGACLFLGVLLGFAYAGLTVSGFVLAGVAAAALFFLPDLLVYNAALRRQERASKGLAEALDMLTVCVEAGQGFDAALMQVARNVEGPIAGEFARVISEIQIGKSRGEAFSAMGDRVALPEVRNFTTALVQADRLGLPIAAVLREQTSTMRLARKQKAEEQAQKVTVKIIFPLVLCIFPVLFVVLLGPAAIKMIDAFSSMGR
jgi:tight adherence protein C